MAFASTEHSVIYGSIFHMAFASTEHSVIYGIMILLVLNA